MIYEEDFRELQAKIARLERRQRLLFLAVEKIINILKKWNMR